VSVYASGLATGGEDSDKGAPGWFVEPFGIHEERWSSRGSPTALVCDGRKYSRTPRPTVR